MPELIDPLELGQRVVGIIETGRRTATYKLAVLSALIDYCVEHFPEKAAAPLDVPLDDLADRVIKLYWRQVMPFEGIQRRLYQSSGEKSGDRHLTWCCNACRHTTFGPALGPHCTVMNGPARIR
jgi:hypothetical protein